MDPRWLPLVATTIGSFMSILDSNIVNIALPKILEDFHANLQNGQLIIASYLMALAVVIPLSGFLGERVGMKRLYMITLGLFTLGSVLCGLAWNVQSLIFFRVMQGLGGGMLQPLGMAIVFTMITPLERPKFFALLGIPTLLAPLIGPSLGGYIIDLTSWRMVFLINLPIGLADIFLSYILLKETEIRTDTKLDARGFAFAAIAFPCILMGLTQGSEHGWTSPIVPVLLILGTGSFGLFIRQELRHHDPMLQLRLYKDSMFRLAQVIQWIGFFSLFGLNFLMPLFLERVHGYSAAEAGRILLPMGVGAFLTMNAAGRLYKVIGPRPLSIAGLLVIGSITFFWSTVDQNTGTIPLMLLVTGRGIGLGLFAQTIQLVAYNTVPQGQLPRATALVNVGQRVDGALSTAILTTVLIAGLGIAGAPAGASIGDGSAPVPDMVIAFHWAFRFLTVMNLSGAALSIFIHDRVLEESKAGKRTGETPITPTAEQHGGVTRPEPAPAIDQPAPQHAALVRPEMTPLTEQNSSTRSA